MNTRKFLSINRFHYFSKKYNFIFKLSSFGFCAFLSNFIDSYSNRFFSKTLISPLTKGFKESFNQPEVKKSTKKLVEALFKDKQTLRIITQTIKHSIKAKNVEEVSKIYGKAILREGFKEEFLRRALKIMIIDIVKRETVKKAGKDLSLNVFLSDSVKSAAGKIMKDALLREDTLSEMLSLFKRGFARTGGSSQFLSKYNSTFKECINDPLVKQKMYKDTFNIKKV